MEETNDNKKKRLSLACNVCRRKKIKCDGIKPACGKCLRFNLECTYTTNMKKRGPRQGHIELLEQRLKKMEELMTAGKDNGVILPTTTTTTTTTTTAQPQQQLGYKVIPQMLDLTAPLPSTPSSLLDNDFPSDDIVEHLLDIFFRNCATVSPVPDVVGFRRNVRNKTCSPFVLYCFMAAAARFSKRPDIVQEPLWMSGEKYASKARDMINKVIDMGSIEHVQGLLMLTMNEYGCGRGPRCWTYTGMTIRMTIEIGLHKETIFEEEPNTVLTLDKWYYYETRRRVFWDAFVHDKFASASTGRPPFLDARDAEIMLPVDNNVFHIESGNDFYQNSLNNTRLIHYHIIRHDITNEITGIQYIPLNPKLPQYKIYLSRVGWDSYIFQESVILGKVTQLVNRGYKVENGLYEPYQENSEFEKLDKELDLWAESLPHQMRNTPANLERFRLLDSGYRSAKYILGHILHNSLVVLLNRPSLVISDMPALGQVTQTVQDKVHKSMEKCLAAADNVTVMLKDLCSQIDVIPPFITYLVYTTATVMVNSSFSMNLNESQKAKTALHEYFRFLAEMKVYWAMSGKLYFMVDDLYQVHQKVLEQQPDSNTQESSSSTTTTTTTTKNDWNNGLEQSLAHPYPCSYYCGNVASTTTIPIHKLPLAEVSMSTSDFTLDQHWEYSTDNNNVYQNISGIRKKSLFTDTSISTFDLWMQQQQQKQQQQEQ